MSNEEFWALKIVALLHDPPDKLLLGLKDHETRTEPMLQKLLARASKLEDWREWKIAKKADTVAAAMDRGTFPGAVTISAKDETVPSPGATLYWADPEIRHPLSGELFTLTYAPPATRQSVSQAYNNAIDRLVTEFSDLYRLYLALWRRLPEAVPPLWRLIPGDTRMVDHSLWEHLDAATAVAGALHQPGLLIFSLGPVQGFIAQARRTQDLWIGSYILSYLAWQAAQAIAKECGPDAVLYPALRGQPLVDHWLATNELGILEEGPDARRMSVATLPNKVVALVPAEKADRLVRKIVLPAVRAAWAQLATDVLSHLSGLETLDPSWQQMWAEQTGVTPSGTRDVYWELYWSYHSWGQTRPYGDPESWCEAEKALDEYKRLSFPLRKDDDGTPNVPPDWHFDKVFAAYRAVQNGKQVNIGTVYSLLHDLAQRGFDARKGVRDFVQTAERGEKCTVCGERAALHNSDSSRAGVRQVWGDLARALQRENRYAELKPEGRERLCAICAIKRFAQRAFFEDAVGLRGGFPSTSTIAAATFREQLLLELKDGTASDGLWQVLRTFLSGLHNARSLDGRPIPTTVSPEAIPRLWNLVERDFEGEDRARLRAFLGYDGDLLYPDTYTVERFRDDYRLEFALQVLSDLRSKLRSLLSEAARAGVRRPATYFGILRLDGDRMGAWLAGERLPAFHQVLNSQAKPLFEKQFKQGKLTDWQPLLDETNPAARRLLGPASHAAISHALANFALHCVQQVVEDRYPGRVVYAGGDDVLALLPADCALAAARELRALYSGEAEVIVDADGAFEQVQVKFGDPRCTGYLDLDDEVLLTMGPFATASAGIAIAHHQAPLDSVLAAAREAEHAAKETYGRNAICVYALKRSGEALRVGSRWYYPDEVTDPIGLFGELRAHFREGRLSSKLVYEVHSQARALPLSPTQIRRSGSSMPLVVPLAAVKGALKRLLVRHKGDHVSREEARQRAKDLAPRLAAWAHALDQHRADWEKDWLKQHQHDWREPDPLDEDYAPQPGPVELGKWLLLARFLETGGEE